MPDINASQLRTVLFSTEASNNPDVLNNFSYAGGNSTYSFGVLQFDVGSNHGNVQDFLQNNGFSTEQVVQLSQHGGLNASELSALNTQLHAIPHETLDGFTDSQLVDSVTHIHDVVAVVQAKNPAIGALIANSQELQLALADYDNQFSISGAAGATPPSNGMLAYLEGDEVSLPGGALQLNDSISRADIQNFINATRYGVDHPTSVAHREERLETALGSLNLMSTDPARAANLPGGKMHEGNRNTSDVSQLQATLAELNYTGTNGKALATDGNFGPKTEAAIRAFQIDHHLVVDGIAGSKTFGALALAMTKQENVAELDNLNINNPSHAGNPLYQQAHEAICRLDTQLGRQSDQYSKQLAGALAVAGKASGMSEINQVALSEDGSRAWAVQDGLLQRVVHVETQTAVNTSLAQSGKDWVQIQIVQNGDQVLSKVLEQTPPAAPTQQTTSIQL